MEASSGRTTVEDDVSAALRRAFGFAGLFGLTALAAIACTARTPQPVSGLAADRLMAQEALWRTEASGAPTIAFPAALLGRRADPKIAALLGEAQHQLAADRAAAAARRAAVLQRIAEVRADRDLRESQSAVLSLKISQTYARAQQRGPATDQAALRHDLLLLRIQAAKATGDAALASRELKALDGRMMTLAKAEHARAKQRLTAVRDQLRGG
ncbi:hypothetical protein GCM10022253_32210 [Sphingomonas endophytica]|uniref:Lipoprotein n=1 Tax=Sphingomonas endophytica TaxID=869719 RepID=A0ABR6N5V8_9SPHN|nr:hypothetical protein [Sphingomonas endophytica]MBB5726173.1 hypothetical protein [Sphingomonas endophytica]